MLKCLAKRKETPDVKYFWYSQNHQCLSYQKYCRLCDHFYNVCLSARSSQSIGCDLVVMFTLCSSHYGTPVSRRSRGRCGMFQLCLLGVAGSSLGMCLGVSVIVWRRTSSLLGTDPALLECLGWCIELIKVCAPCMQH